MIRRIWHILFVPIAVVGALAFCHGNVSHTPFLITPAADVALKIIFAAWLAVTWPVYRDGVRRNAEKKLAPKRSTPTGAS